MLTLNLRTHDTDCGITGKARSRGYGGGSSATGLSGETSCLKLGRWRQLHLHCRGSSAWVLLLDYLAIAVPVTIWRMVAESASIP